MTRSTPYRIVCNSDPNRPITHGIILPMEYSRRSLLIGGDGSRVSWPKAAIFAAVLIGLVIACGVVG